MKILDNINFHLTKHRSAYLICVSGFLVLSLGTFFGLRHYYENEYDGIFFAIWSVLSILIGSLVFFQLNENNLYKDLDGFMKELNRMMRQIRDDNNLNELYIITPNLNIGQTKCPKQFNVFKQRIRELAQKNKLIYISVWGLENCLYVFDRNEDGTHAKCVSESNSVRIDSLSLPHMNYVAELLKKAPKVKHGEDINMMNSLMRDYNSFITSLMGYQTLNIYATDNPEKMNGRFFVVYNGKRLFYSTVKDDGSMSSELIKEEEFINTVWPSLREKYFLDSKLVDNKKD